jgi:uncharacterized damage-inducible protein DinB
LEEIKNLLVNKFQEIKTRIERVLEQLNDDDVNWRPNESSNSIANLIIHMDGNIKERIGKGINKKDFIRQRDQEFEWVTKSKSELQEIMKKSFGEIIETTKGMTDHGLAQTQIVRNQERTNLDVLIQCATHFSEHLGQILYIGKIIKNQEYISTSIPKGKQIKD